MFRASKKEQIMVGGKHSPYNHEYSMVNNMDLHLFNLATEKRQDEGNKKGIERTSRRR
jgi:hypothetical protein